ncbi:hypothetical protein AJ88_45110 [Mesorhizobium amorphae CCBAU 01583]|nr:hypothetical protein AJ88_45110 [Mesorhizobium amorphae CCBAU 01583]
MTRNVIAEHILPGRSVPARRRHISAGRATSGFRVSALAVLLVIALLSLLPMARLVVAAVAPGGELDFGAFADRLARPAAMRAMGHTLDTAFFGAVFAVCLGGPFAVAVTMTDLPGRKALGFLLLLPLMIAPQVTALSWLHLFGPSSTLLDMVGLAPPPGTPNPMLGRNGIILLYAVQHAPIVFITREPGFPGCRVISSRPRGPRAPRPFTRCDRSRCRSCDRMSSPRPRSPSSPASAISASPPCSECRSTI